MQIYYNRPAALETLKYTEFLEKYNTSSMKPKYYEDSPDTENNVTRLGQRLSLSLDNNEACEGLNNLHSHLLLF